jgi:hypothetical protein
MEVRLLAAYVIVALVPGQSISAPLVFDDGGVHVIDYSAPDGILLENDTRVIIEPGGEVLDVRTPLNGISNVEVAGGTVQGDARVHRFSISSGTVAGTIDNTDSPGSSIVVSGGSVAHLNLFGAQPAEVSGGAVGSIFMEALTTLRITGGSIASDIVSISGTIDLDGGYFGDDILSLMDTSAITIRGGVYSLGTEFIYRTASPLFTMTFFGALSLSDPVHLGDGISETFISGILQDGNEISNRVICDQSFWNTAAAPCAAISLIAPAQVPTPGPLGLFIAGLTALAFKCTGRRRACPKLHRRRGAWSD